MNILHIWYPFFVAAKWYNNESSLFEHFWQLMWNSLFNIVTFYYLFTRQQTLFAPCDMWQLNRFLISDLSSEHWRAIFVRIRGFYWDQAVSVIARGPSHHCHWAVISAQLSLTGTADLSWAAATLVGSLTTDSSGDVILESYLRTPVGLQGYGIQPDSYLCVRCKIR